MNALEKIWDGSQIHPDINTRDNIFKIGDCIRQTKNEWKEAELSANIIFKGLHKVFKAVVNELNNMLPTLRYLGSEISHFIPEPSNSSEVIRLPADVKKNLVESNYEIDQKFNQQSDLCNG